MRRAITRRSPSRFPVAALLPLAYGACAAMLTAAPGRAIGVPALAD